MGHEVVRGQHPDQVLDVQLDLVPAGSELVGDLLGDLWEAPGAVESGPYGGARHVQVVQVLAVEQHCLPVELDPVDVIGPARLGPARREPAAERSTG